MMRNNRKREKRKLKTEHKKGRGELLNSVVPLMLICLGLWTDKRGEG